MLGRTIQVKGAKMTENTYWFGFRQTRPAPPGKAVPCGPYRTREIAKLEREKAKAWDCAVSIPYVALSKEEAEKRAEELTGKI